MLRPTIADLRNANRILEEGKDDDMASPPPPPPKKKKRPQAMTIWGDWLIWFFIMIVSFAYLLKGLGKLNTLLILGLLGPSKLREWHDFLVA